MMFGNKSNYESHSVNQTDNTDEDNISPHINLKQLADIKQQNERIMSQQQNIMGKIDSSITDISTSDIINGLATGFFITKSLQNYTPTSLSTTNNLSKSYDPYFDYNQKKGTVSNNQKLVINKQYINIDSSARDINPQVVSDITSSQNLPNNPFYFSQDNIRIGNNIIKQNLLWINIPSHKLNLNDKITLNGFSTSKQVFSSENTTLFTFYKGGSYMRININPNMPIQNQDSSQQSKYYIEQQTIKQYKTSDLYCTISGFQKSISTLYSQTYIPDTYTSSQNLPTQLPSIPTISGMPVNLLDATHRIYLFLEESDFANITNPDAISEDLLVDSPNLYKLDHFYIKIDNNYEFDTDYINSILAVSGISVILTFDFNHFAGIPINKVNAEYPIDISDSQGYHLVNSVSKDYISINIPQQGLYYEYYTSNNINYTITPLNFGDSDISMGLITSIVYGNTSSNKYNISLPYKLNNVIQVQLVGTIFPNSSYTFTNFDDSVNNKLYWQNEDDGSTVYYISIDSGNYDSPSLITEVQKNILNTKRIYDTWDTGIPISFVKSGSSATIQGTGYSTGTLSEDGTQTGELISITGQIEIENVWYECKLTGKGKITINNKTSIMSGLSDVFVGASVIIIFDGLVVVSQITTLSGVQYNNLYFATIYGPQIGNTILCDLIVSESNGINIESNNITQLNMVGTLFGLDQTTYNISFSALPTSNLRAYNLIGLGTSSNLTPPINRSYVTNSNYIEMLIDTNKNITTFKSFKQISLYLPIRFVQPYSETKYIPESERTNTKIYSTSNISGILPISASPIQNVYQVVFNQIYQTIQNGSGYVFDVPVVKIGDTVNFVGLTNTYVIPANILNAKHTVYYVDNISGTFSIITKLFNTITPFDTLGSDNGGAGGLGGVEGKMFMPNNFRLLFNYTDTMGTQIGFRNAGKPNSITKFSNQITNNDAYDGEQTYVSNNGYTTLIDPSGNELLLRGNSLKLCGTDYILMVIEEFSNIQNIATTKNKRLKNIFAKINFSIQPSRIVYDTFVSAPIIFSNKIDINSLTVSFYDMFGNPFDFNGLDHSFTLEIITTEYVPLGTNINTNKSLY